MEIRRNESQVYKYARYVGYGVGAVGLDLSYGLFYGYLSKYLTDVLLMPAAFLLILTPIARIWDGINDPIMGTIVDSTKMKMGKYRPWIMIGASLNAVVFCLNFGGICDYLNKCNILTPCVYIFSLPLQKRQGSPLRVRG